MSDRSGRLLTVVALLMTGLVVWVCWQKTFGVDQVRVATQIRALGRGDTAARLDAAAELASVDVADLPRVAAVLAFQVEHDPDADVRAVAIYSLGKILAAWVQTRSAPPGETTKAAGTQRARLNLKDAPAEATAFRALVRTLNDERPEVRQSALAAFQVARGWFQLTPELDAEVYATLDKLISSRNNNATIRVGALQSLAGITSMRAAGRDRVMTLMTSDSMFAVRFAAMQALVDGWPGPELYRILLDRHKSAATATERGLAPHLLLRLSVLPIEIIPELLDLMNSDPDMAEVVPQLLTDPRQNRANILPALREAATGELAQADPFAPLPALTAMIQIDADSAETQALLRPLWERFLTHPAAGSPPTVLALNRLGRSAALLVPEWRVALQGANPAAQHQAALMLQAVGPPGLVAIDDLEAANRRDPSGGFQPILDHLRQLRHP